MMYSAYKLNKQGDNYSLDVLLFLFRTSLPIWNLFGTACWARKTGNPRPPFLGETDAVGLWEWEAVMSPSCPGMGRLWSGHSPPAPGKETQGFDQSGPIFSDPSACTLSSWDLMALYFFFCLHTELKLSHGMRVCGHHSLSNKIYKKSKPTKQKNFIKAGRFGPEDIVYWFLP